MMLAETEGGVVKVTDSNFEQLISAGGPVVVDFWASWCGPCVAMAPIFEKMARKMPGVTFAKMNVDENQLPNQMGIQSIPTMVLFRDGKMVSSRIGLQSKAAFQHWLEHDAE